MNTEDNDYKIYEHLSMTMWAIDRGLLSVSDESYKKIKQAHDIARERRFLKLCEKVEKLKEEIQMAKR